MGEVDEDLGKGSRQLNDNCDCDLQPKLTKSQGTHGMKREPGAFVWLAVSLLSCRVTVDILFVKVHGPIGIGLLYVRKLAYSVQSNLNSKCPN